MMNQLAALIIPFLIIDVKASSAFQFQHNKNNDLVVVIGKIIIDDYRKPSSASPLGYSNKRTVGGGGPQAAWGSSAALAVLDTFQPHPQDTSTTYPSKQRVAFFGPVGAFGKEEQESLAEILEPVVECVKLIEEPSLKTPTIQLWHDDQQEIKWKPLNDSWGENGADSLWRNRPSAEDVLSITHEEVIGNLHLIMEVGFSAPASGDDSLLLIDETLLNQVRHVGIEPVAFPEESVDGDLAISPQDVRSIQQHLSDTRKKMDIIIPDLHLVRSLEGTGFWKARSPPLDVVARYGPRGSRIYSDLTKNEKQFLSIPAATLETPDKKPVNPTGAGNAYSAALSTCRSKGLSLSESACIASAVGAVVCEYEHLPPWNWEIIDRLRRGALEVLECTRLEEVE
jgi:hypothetical protein